LASPSTTSITGLLIAAARALSAERLKPSSRAITARHSAIWR